MGYKSAAQRKAVWASKNEKKAKRKNQKVKKENKTGPVKGINQMLNLKPKPNDIFLFD